MKSKKIIFSSGGTGGHIFPAVGIIEYFLKKDYLVVLVTDLRGYQYIKNKKEIKSFILNADTPFNKRNYKKIISYFKIFTSIIRSIFFLLNEKPCLVFGFGGYVSFPLLIAAKILNIPSIIYENNLVIGRANKYLLPFVRKVLIAPDIILNFPAKYNDKLNKVGHILRKEILDYQPSKKKINNSYFSILILGGSQGAKIFGTIIPNVIQKLNKFDCKIKVYHQCIKDQKQKLINFYRDNNISSDVFEFSDNILEHILQSDIVISRCGASSTAELIHTRTPFIAVPYPHAMDNHQYLNAKYCEDRGYCWILEQINFNDETLFNLIIKIIKNKKELEKKIENMKSANNKNTNEKIENILEKLLQK